MRFSSTYCWSTLSIRARRSVATTSPEDARCPATAGTKVRTRKAVRTRALNMGGILYPLVRWSAGPLVRGSAGLGVGVWGSPGGGGLSQRQQEKERRGDGRRRSVLVSGGRSPPLRRRAGDSSRPRPRHSRRVSKPYVALGAGGRNCHQRRRPSNSRRIRAVMVLAFNDVHVSRHRGPRGADREDHRVRNQGPRIFGPGLLDRSTDRASASPLSCCI